MVDPSRRWARSRCLLLLAGWNAWTACDLGVSDSRSFAAPPATSQPVAAARSEAAPVTLAAMTPPVAPSEPARPSPAATDENAPERVARAHTGDRSSEASPAAADRLRPLDDRERALLASGEEDPPIEVETHYIQSNETRHDLYFPYIEKIGGAYMGVGSDQNYTMAAKAGAELMFLMDIDTRVVDLHRMYAVFIPNAETPDELLRRWAEEHRLDSEAELERGLAHLDEGERRRILRGYRNGRETVYRHLLRVIGRKRDGAPTSWLSDPTLYDHVRTLYSTGRVRVMVGNLAGSASVDTVGRAARSLDIPVRTVYFSNAEEYFKYRKDFVRSIRSLAADERSMVLRTIYSQAWEHADLWAYQVQPLLDFQVRLGDARNRSRNPMLRYAKVEGALDPLPEKEGLTAVGIRPAEPNAGPTSAAANVAVRGG